MTIARPIRLFSALALAAGVALPAVASASGGPGNHRAHRYHGPEVRAHYVSGVLTAVGGTTAPATLTVQTAGGINVTVTVATTTTVVRRYNGISSLDELSTGDRVWAWGSFEAGSTATFDATRIKDWSIQRAYTRVVGLVKSVDSTGAGVTLVVGHGRGRLDPYHHGETVSVTFSANTIVMSGSVTETVSAVQPGMRILTMGVYDRVSHTLRADRVRILGDGHRKSKSHGDAAPEPTATPTT